MAINDVSLTSGMRANLLSLQGTVDLLNRTQSRLSSGKKVNSAIDNPVSFFASQALTARASTIDSLKDGMGQAVQTIQAADKGIKAITAMIEQAKGIAQAALSAPASTGFSTVTLTLDNVAKGNTVAIAGSIFTAGPAAESTSYDSFGVDLSSETTTAGDTVSIGGQTYTATLGHTDTTYTGFSIDLSSETITAGDKVTVGGVDYTAINSVTTTSYSKFTVDATTIAGGETIDIGGVTYTATTGAPANALEFTNTAAGLKAAVDAHQAGLYTLTVNGTNVEIQGDAASLDATSVVAAAITVTNTHTNPVTPAGDGEFIVVGDANADATALAAAINNLQGTGNGDLYTVTNNGDGSITIAADNAVPLTSSTVALSVGSTTDIAISSTTTTADAPLAAGEFLVTGDGSADALALRAAVIAREGAGAYNIAEAGGVLTITAGSSALTATTVVAGSASTTDIAISSETTTTAGALTDLEFAQTGNNVVDAINLADAFANSADVGVAALRTQGYTATADNGVVTIAKGLGTTAAGHVTLADTTPGQASITEKLVEASSDLDSLQKQYNEMRSQISELAMDSGYKGKNLLDNKTLTVQFEGTTLNVVGFDASSDGLNMTAATWTADNTTIDADLGKLDEALSKIRQNSSKLAGNLSIITVRQDFSTNMINTLTEGSDKLTLADANEEGANMLMLQTRQTLSTTALSMSAQAAQSVLRLFQ